MIGKLSGRIDYRGSDHVLLDVGGVGYLVFVSERTLAGSARVRARRCRFIPIFWCARICCSSFGFPTLAEKEWHRLLDERAGNWRQGLDGRLGALGPDALAQAIALGDWSAVKAAPGVGPKIAQRVVNELKGKAPAMMAMPGEALDTVIEGSVATPAVAPANTSAQADALSALGNLGYGPGEAAAAVAEAGRESPEADASALIRAALKRLAPV